MQNKAFSTIGIVIILIIIIGGGYFGWQYFGSLKEAIKNLTPEQEETLQKNIEQAGIRERDAKRVGDIAMIQTALQLYSDDHQDYYPAVIYGEMANLFLGYLGNKDLLDPSTNEPYFYYSCPPQGRDYHLGAKLEDKNSSYLTQDADASKCGSADFSGEDPIYDVSTLQATPTAEGPGEVIEDETADWETYRNGEYGFEVKCFGLWSEEEAWWVEKPKIFLKCGEEETPKQRFISLQVRQNLLSEEIQCVQNRNLLPAGVLGKITINDIEFCKMEYIFEGDHNITYLTIKDEVGYELSLSNKYIRKTETGVSLEAFLSQEEMMSKLDIFNQIISTFRFLEE
ncbi:MAG: hypothetical protein ABIF80_01895 [Patescibacteria group bacterium]